MALIVEDGTGKDDAESYISVVDASTYVINYYGSADPFLDAPEPDQEMYLRRGMQSLDNEYRTHLKGTRLTQDQAGAWPRVGVTDKDGYAVPSDSVPRDVQYAQVEYARRIAAGTEVHPDSVSGIKREKIDVIETEYFSSEGQVIDFQQIDMLMDQYTAGSGDVEFLMQQG